MPFRLRSTLLLSLLTTVPALASDAFTNFGIQAHVAHPTGTLGNATNLDRKTGLGLGLQLPITLGEGHVLRPKVDYLACNRETGGSRYKLETLSLLVDYTFYPEYRREGVYFIAGAGLHSSRRDLTRSFAGVALDASDSGSGLAYNLGMGYAFNPNVALELKYLGLDQGDMKFAGQPAEKGFMGNAVVASLSFLF
jgi:opacity protein-like surface antigen